ncbi:hypothetical protein RQP46_006517 [Phenoliferia psychrophenolica]
MRGPITLKPEPFIPTFSDQELAGLKADLAGARLPRPTYASSKPEYGIQSEWMAKALDRWKNGFDWRSREAGLNSVSNFMVDVPDEAAPSGSFKIHFIAEYSKDPNAIPLLLLHGWPGSLIEFIETIKILRKSTSPAFHLICPSQVGYGWSDPPPLDRGYGMYDLSRLMNTLMCGLGFESGYAAQGGDIGSVLARIMSVKYDSCKVININYMPMGPVVDSPESYAGLSEREVTNAKKALRFASNGRGYGQMHVGEKLRDWVDDPLDLDVVLELVTMWWIQETFPTSIYAYSELVSGVGAWNRDPALYLTKPFGFSSFAEEIASAPESWAAETGNLQYYRYNERGGHFAAKEQPQVFASNLIECFGKLWPGTK